MTGFLTLEMRRCVRDVRYLVIALAMPIGLYLLFTGLFSAHGQRAQGLPQPTELMVAMIAYGAMWAVFAATGPRIAQERAIGWTRQLRVTPLSPPPCWCWQRGPRAADWSPCSPTAAAPSGPPADTPQARRLLT